MKRLEQVFKAPLIEAYSMTEAAHQIASNPLPPAARKPGSVGLSAGPEVAIMDAAGSILTPGRRVRSSSAAPTLQRAMKATRRQTARPIPTDGSAPAIKDGWIKTATSTSPAASRRSSTVAAKRFQPREVDEALLEDPEVVQAVTFAVPHASLGEDIAAAVVIKDKAGLTGNALRQGLFGRLADFKIPNKIIIVTEIPKGPTGKILRIGLADKLARELQDGYTAPRSALETSLAAIFAEALGTESPIGIHDNFFSAGGDSLSGARVIDRIRERLRCELPVTALFRLPTIAELSGEVRENSSPQRPTISRKSDRISSLLSLAQQRMWLVEQLDPEYSINNVTRTLHLHGDLSQAALELALNKMIDRHEILRTTFSSDDGDAMQNIAPSLSLTLTTTDLTDRPPTQQKDELRRLAENEARHSFDLTRLPLIRAVLIKLGRQEHVLIITLHHMISDGWSMGIFSRELEALYRSNLHNQPSPLPELCVQYADYAEWQRRWLQDERHPPDRILEAKAIRRSAAGIATRPSLH